MISSLVRKHLEELSKSSFKKVDGAMALAALKKEGQFPSPAVFVIPVSDKAGENTRVNGVSQNIREVFSTVIAIKAINSRSGKEAEDELDLLRKELKKDLVGWVPSADYGAVEFASGEMVDMVNGWVWWQDNFRAETYIFA